MKVHSSSSKKWGQYLQIAFMLFFVGHPPPSWAAVHDLANASIKLSYDDATGILSLANATDGHVFATSHSFAGKDVTVKKENSSLLLGNPNASSTRMELREGLPFALITQTLTHTGEKEADFSRVRIGEFLLTSDAARVRTLGTGGLLPPDKNPGSYLWLTCADPATREGVVAGFASQHRGSGVLFPKVVEGNVEITARLDHGHLFLKPSESIPLDTLAIGYFADVRLGLEQLADLIASEHHIHLRPRKATYCTWYAEGPGRGGAGSPATVRELAEFIRRSHLLEHGLGVIQIDDRWQDGPTLDGPATHFDRVNPKGSYKDGIQPVADFVQEQGQTLGIWWLPFGRNHMEAAYANKQDWFVKKPDGTPLRQRSFGGTCLDATHPDVETHLGTIARTLRSWGAQYYKMDGLSAGAGVDHYYINDGYVEDHFGECLPLHQREMTNIQALRHGLDIIRKGAGDDTFFSGCALSQNMRMIAGTIGLVDSMRIGPDFNHDKQGIRTGPLRGSWNYFLNGRVWWNDPDPVKMRVSDETTTGDNAATGGVPLEQARLSASWIAMTDQFFLISDWLPNLPPERLEILKRTMLPHGATARPVDYLDNNLPSIWLVSDKRSGVQRHVIGLFNFHEAPLSISDKLDWIGIDGSKSWHAFDFWKNQLLPDITDTLEAEIPPFSCRIIALRANEARPLLLSTSRHVSQGILDVVSETWDGTTLSGISNLPGGESTELRIILPPGWTLQSATGNAGSRVETSATNGLIRVTLPPAPADQITWKLTFSKGEK